MAQKKTPRKGGRTRAARAPKPSLRTLSVEELMKVRGGATSHLPTLTAGSSSYSLV